MKVLVCAGPPLSGKSTVAKYFATKNCWTYLEIDKILSLLIPNSNRCLEHRKMAYRATHLLIKIISEFKQNVVVDCTYSRSFYRNDLVEIAHESNASIYLVEFLVDAETALARFANRRNHPAIDLNTEKIIKLADTYPYTNAGLALNLSLVNIDNALAKIEDFISTSFSLNEKLWVSGSVFDD